MENNITKAEYDAKYYIENKEKVLARNKAWYELNKNKRLKQIKNWQTVHSKREAKRLKSHYESNKTKILMRQARYNAELKVEALSHYGFNGRLQCCWPDCEIADIDMLSLDHINNNGAKHRKQQGGGVLLYKVLKKSGFPVGYQTLCHNLQWKKELMRRRINSITGEISCKRENRLSTICFKR